MGFFWGGWATMYVNEIILVGDRPKAANRDRVHAAPPHGCNPPIEPFAPPHK